MSAMGKDCFPGLLVVGSLSLLVVGSLFASARKRAVAVIWAPSLSLAWAGLGHQDVRASLLLGLDLSPRPCTLGQGFLVVPPLPGVGYLLCASSQAEGLCSSQPHHPPACLHLCFLFQTAGFCSVRRTFEASEEVFWLPAPAPHPPGARRGPCGGPHGSQHPRLPPSAGLASCLLHFRSLSSPPAQLCPRTHLFCLPWRPGLLDFQAAP